jgi:hypothetical protein
MPIQVTCPGCLSRFAVSDKYAGKKGPCPKCKKEITVPEKSAQVVIHAPEVEGPKDSKGVAVLKPIKRVDFVVGWKTWTAVGIGALVVFGVAIAIRVGGHAPPNWLVWLGAIGLAPPIAMFGYTFLRNDELEGYSGREYLVRIAICSLVFALTWLIYLGLAKYFGAKSLAEVPGLSMGLLMLVMAAIGTGTALASLELEFGQSVVHYLGYFTTTFLLAWIMGVELAQPLAKVQPKKTPSSAVVPRKIPTTPKKSQSAKPAPKAEATKSAAPASPTPKQVPKTAPQQVPNKPALTK